MEKSIFSGLSPAKLRIAFAYAKESPQAMGAVLIVVVALIAALAFAGMLAAHHIGGFYAKIAEEDERAREEEEAEAAAKADETAKTADTADEGKDVAE